MNAPEYSIDGIQNPAQVLADIDLLTQYIEWKVAASPEPFRTIQAGEMFHTVTWTLLDWLKSNQKALQSIAENLRSDIESTRVFDNRLYDRRQFARYLLKEVLKTISDEEFLKSFALYTTQIQDAHDLEEAINTRLQWALAS